MNKELKRTVATEKMMEILKRGEWISSVPYGYTYLDSDVSNRHARPVVVHDEEAHVIRTVFELYASGAYSTRSLQEKLANDNIHIKRNTLSSFLTNPFYMGIMRVNGMDFTHNYERIISKELFEKVQNNLKKGNMRPQKFVTVHDVFLYKSLLHCAECGHSVTYECAKGKFIYYRCANKLNQKDSSKTAHKVKFIRQEKLTPLIHQKVLELPNGDTILDFIKYGTITTGLIVLKDIFESIHMNPITGELTFKTKDVYLQNTNYALTELKKKIAFNQKDFVKVQEHIGTKLSHFSDTQSLLIILKYKPLTIEDLMALTDMPIEDIQFALFDLQMDGKIYQDDAAYWHAK